MLALLHEENLQMSLKPAFLYINVTNEFIYERKHPQLIRIKVFYKDILVTTVTA